MNSQPLINSLSFQLAFYHVTCCLDKDLLSIKVSSLNQISSKQAINLHKMQMVDGSLDLWVSSIPFSEQKPIEPLKNNESKMIESKIQNMVSTKLESMQMLYQKLETKMLEIHQDSKKMTKMLQQKQKTRLRKPSWQSVSHQDQQKSKQGKVKMQMLNNMLQQKLLQKQGHIVSLQKKLFDRDELVRQLADKLMVANSQKDDLYSQYQKILQTTIFNNEEQSFQKSSKAISFTERPPKQIIVVPESVQIKLSSNQEQTCDKNEQTLEKSKPEDTKEESIEKQSQQ